LFALNLPHRLAVDAFSGTFDTDLLLLLLMLRQPHLQTVMMQFPFFVVYPVLLWFCVIVLMRFLFCISASPRPGREVEQEQESTGRRITTSSSLSHKTSTAGWNTWNRTFIITVCKKNRETLEKLAERQPE
jgi:hypothetical protein